jgi:hypothetical protein
MLIWLAMARSPAVEAVAAAGPTVLMSAPVTTTRPATTEAQPGA